MIIYESTNYPYYSTSLYLISRTQKKNHYIARLVEADARTTAPEAKCSVRTS